MPLYCILSETAPGVSREEVRRHLPDHLKFQFESERAGRLFAAGPLGEIEKSNLGMYILITKTEEEAREIAEKDPFHVRGIRKYDLRLWNFHESSILGVGVRAWLNGTDTSYRGYWPPQG